MPRKALERSDFYPYHVYNRCTEQAFYPVQTPHLWNRACFILNRMNEMFETRLHSFVLMSNHYHLLISTPQLNLDDSIGYFQTQFSKWIGFETNRKIYKFESRYKWSLIRDPLHYLSVYRYIYQNPLRVGLANRVENYQYSTLRLNGRWPRIEEHPFSRVLDSRINYLEWLNSVGTSNELKKIRRGLKRAVFTPPIRLR